MNRVNEMLQEFINQDSAGRIVTYAELVDGAVHVEHEWGGERMTRTVDLLELLAFIWSQPK